MPESAALAAVYESVSKNVRETVASIVYGEASTIVDTFYTELLVDPRAQTFIDHEKVRTQLKGSLENWLKELFSLQAVTRIDALMERQVEVLRSAFESHEFNMDGGSAVMVTASIGVAMHSGHPDYKTVLEAADKALYEAKHGGKNRVVLAALPSLIGE